MAEVMASMLIFFFERTASDDENEPVSVIEWDQLKDLDLLNEDFRCPLSGPSVSRYCLTVKAQ